MQGRQGCLVGKTSKKTSCTNIPWDWNAVQGKQIKRIPITRDTFNTDSLLQKITTSSKKDQVDLKTLRVHLAGLNIEQGGGFDVDHPAVVHADDNGDHYCVIMIAVVILMVFPLMASKQHQTQR